MNITKRTLVHMVPAFIAANFLGGCWLKGNDCTNSGTCAPSENGGGATGGNTATTTSTKGGASGSSGTTPVTGGTVGTGATSTVAGGSSAIATTAAPCNDNCSGSTPICKAATNACVECAGNGDCKDAGKPICDTSANKCVGCIQGTDCKDAAKPVCNSASQSCVACAANSDCKDAAASRCDVSTNTCTPCAIDSDCTQISGKNVCLVGSTGQANQCVQCTGKKYAACGQSSDGKALVCDSLAHQCTSDKKAQSADLCQPCVSDAQCRAGQACAVQTFKGATVGFFCFWKQGDPTSGAPADCTVEANRPFVNAITNTVTIDGDTTTLCTLRSNTSTCIAVPKYGTNCASSGTPSNNECGFAFGIDSKCTPYGSTQYRCTTACLSPDDCAGSGTGSTITCAQDGSQKFCTLL